MKNIIILIIQIVFILPTIAQENTNTIQVTRQGFGTHGGLDMSVGFVNEKLLTEGSAYYFDNWDTEGIIYIKDKGRVKIKEVNINLYDSSLEAIYDEKSVFTFDSENLMKIVINDKVFRTFEINNELKIIELIYNGKLSIYKYVSVIYAQGSANPMLARKTNKYIKNTKYYLYSKGELTHMKLTKKAIAKLLQSDKVSQNSILNFIKDNKLTLNDEADLIQVFEFVNN